MVWESRKYHGRKRRPFSAEQTEQLEVVYQRHCDQMAGGGAPLGVVKVTHNLEVSCSYPP